MTSIRRRTAWLVALSTSILLGLGGVALFLLVREALTGQFDEGLWARAAAFQSLTRVDAGRVEMDIAGEVLPAFQPGPNAEYFAAWVSDGNAWRGLERSESLRPLRWEAEDASIPPGRAMACTLPDGRRGRLLSVEFVPSADPEGPDDIHNMRPSQPAAPSSGAPVPRVRLLVAQSTASLDRALATLAGAIAGVGAALVLASVLAVRWAVRRGTSPLDALSFEVAALGPATLHQRLAVDHLPSELSGIAGRLNELLGRLDGAFVREKRFTDAASHELRTPIAALRMLLEVGLSRERSPERWEQTAREGLEVLDRAQLLIEALLGLSRAEASKRSARPDVAADLASILEHEARRAREASGRPPTDVQVQTTGPALARVDPTLAGTIIGHLLDNALRHGVIGAQQPVRCTLTGEGGLVRICVANHAPGMTRSDLGHLFEPFWRKDDSREAPSGFGLGLAVSRALAEALGGRLDATMEDAEILRVVVEFPT